METRAPEDVPPFTFNCDIATPVVRGDDAVFAVDLWLHVLVRADGVTHGVYDRDEFDEALALSWLSNREASAALSELRWLVELVEAGSLVEFLAEIYPFGPSAAPPAPEMQRVPLTEVGATGLPPTDLRANVHFLRTSSRCQRRSVCGRITNEAHRSRGSVLLIVAMNNRSRRRRRGLLTWRLRTFN